MADTPLFPVWRIGRLRMATDGQGVTALVCAQGCPLDCKYCINPGSKTFNDPMRRVMAKELYDTVKKDGLYYTATGGGVTFGGGEPLLHTGFIAQFRKIIPAEWHLYAESSLMIPEKNVYEAAVAVDHFFVDIKDTNPEIYKAYTGGDSKTALSNLALLIKAAGADRITVRVPLIPGYNTDEDRDRSVILLRGMGITDIDLFKYKTAVQKEKQ
ncbi:MAG: radical SAM protein [Clostridia bacterium]|nr:radical SAM protein [Clostridia bacterium]